MARLAGGSLLAELLGNMKKKMAAEDEERTEDSVGGKERSKKAYFYSAHDSTILALFGTKCPIGRPGSL